MKKVDKSLNILYNIQMELPEEKSMFKEKLEMEETEDQSEDPFVPAKLTEMRKEEALIYVEL